LFFYPPQILIILEEVKQLALGGVVRSTHNTTAGALLMFLPGRLCQALLYYSR
jgi:hypothetical protein